jgi:hypothetical protein
MAKIKICKEEDCNNTATTAGYCRLHYLKRWKAIKDVDKAAAARRLNQYIERVCRENPDDYIDVIRKDLRKPDFEEIVGGELDFNNDLGIAFGDLVDDIEIEEMIRKLKIEEGF